MHVNSWKKKMKSLGITFAQYGDTKKIDSVSVSAPSTAGSHVLTKLLATSQEYRKSRLFFKGHKQKGIESTGNRKKWLFMRICG